VEPGLTKSTFKNVTSGLLSSLPPPIVRQSDDRPLDPSIRFDDLITTGVSLSFIINYIIIYIHIHIYIYTHTYIYIY
jgi:hypothetical protein